MKKKCVFLFLFIYIFSLYKGWTQNKDQPYLWHQSPKHLIQKGELYHKRKLPDSVAFVGQQLKKLGEEQASDTLIAWGTYYHASSFGLKYPDSSLTMNQKAYEMFEKEGHFWGKTRTLHSMSAVYGLKGKYDAIDSIHQVLSLLLNGKESTKYNANRVLKRKVMLWNEMGRTDWRKGNYQEAFQSVSKALRVADSLQFEELSFVSLSILGNVQNKMGNYEKSAYYYKQVLDRAKEEENLYIISTCINNLGILYASQKQYDSAYVYFDRSLAVARKMKQPRFIMSRILNLASLITLQGDFQSALPYFEEARVLAKSLGAKPTEISVLTNMVVGYNKTQQYKKAVDIGEEAIRQAKIIKKKETLSDAYLNTSEAYKKLGNYKKAVALLDQHILLKDSMFNQEKLKAIAEMEAKYDNEKKERELAEVKQQAQIQQLEIQQTNILIAALVAGFLLCILLGSFWYRQRLLSEKHHTLIAKQKLLRGQMNPHFFFNVLAAIQSFFWEDEHPKREGKYLARCAKLMRLVLENSREEFISLEQEIETLEEYLALQKLRFQDALDYTITYDESLDIEHFKLPPMLAQPFVENAIEHGLRFKEGMGHIHIHFMRQADGLALKIEDDGIGRIASAKMSQGAFAHKKSLATTITRERIMLLKQAFNKEIRMDIQDVTGPEGEAEGTQVTFLLPLVA